MRKPFKPYDRALQITRLNTEGRGVAHFTKEGADHSSKALILGALPEEEVIATLESRKRSDYRGKLKEILVPSPLRVTPHCGHVPECGGCVLQQMHYPAQVIRKEEIIADLFSPFLKNKNTRLHSIIPCADPWEYRNKMEFSFSQNKEGTRFLGLILAGSRGRVFNLKECSISSAWFAKTVAAVRSWWESSSLQAYFMARDEGTLRTLTLREGKRTGAKMVMLTVSGNAAFAPTNEDIKSFVETIKSTVSEGEPLSIFLRIQQILKGSPTQFYEMHLYGPDHITEKMRLNVHGELLNLTFKISPTSFFQPNTYQAEILYSKALEILNLSKEATVLDLYCGTATLSMAIAHRAKKVIGIELNPHAVFDAQANKELNLIKNVEILQGDVGKTLEVLRQRPEFKPPEAVIVDPPRAGLDPLAISHLLALNPQKILYISCNPATQVENIKTLTAEGYTLTEIQPVDQFPHTLHIENIALLTRE